MDDNTKKSTLLIVDDQLENLQILTQLLAKQDYNILTSETGAGALKIVSENIPDIILLDIVLPDINGFDVCRKLKENQLTKDIPVIFISGLNKSADILEGFKVGGIDYISKPFIAAEVLARVRTHLQTFQMQEQIKKQADELQKSKVEFIRASDLKYRSIFENTGTATLIVDREAHIILANKMCEKLTGYSSKQLIGTLWTNYVAPESLESLKLFSRLKLEKPINSDTLFEANLVNAKNEIRITQLTVGLIPGADLSVVSINDITDLRNAQKKIAENEKKYKAIFESIQDVYFELDKNGVIIEISPSIEALSKGQLKKEDIIGDSFTKYFINQKSRVKFIRSLTHLKSIKDYEVVFRNRNGDSINCAVSAILQTDNKGNLLKVTGSCHDITNSISIRESLKLSNEKFIKTFKMAPVSMTINDGEKRFLDANNAFLKLFGYNIDEVIGHTSEELNLWANDKEREQINNEVKKNGRLHDFEFHFRKKTGEKGVGILYSELIDLDGKLIELKAVVDITDRKKAEREISKLSEDLRNALEKAEASDLLKTAFMNNISHEIRTPLNGILGFAPMIIEPDISQEDKELFLSTLNSSSYRLMNTVSDYMDISLIVSRNMDVHLKEVNLYLILEEVYENFQQECRFKELEFKINTPKNRDPLLLKTDEILIRNILNKLVDNAIKFTAKGSIELGFSLINDATSEEIELFVKDTGQGIAPEAQYRIFESFMQENITRTRAHEGSGLGLSIAKGLTQLLGGKIRLDSEKNVGTTVYVRFPYENIPIKKTPIEDTKFIKSTKILIAEDDDVHYFLLERLMKNKSLTLIRAKNGKEAIELSIQHSDISMVLMDIKMPVMNGLEATRQIKSVRKDLPIIALTAFALSGDEKLAIEAGCSNYIPKPVSKVKLAHLIKQYMYK